MTKKRIIILGASLVVLGVILWAVLRGSKPEMNALDVEFARYISAYTNGMINKNSTVKVVLNSDLAQKIDKDAKAGDLIKFYPSVSGSCKFTDERTIEFTPEKGFKNSQDYVAEFNLGKLVKTDEKRLKKFVFGFSVIKQDMKVLIESQTTTDKKTLKYQSVTGVVRTADYEDLQNIKRAVSAQYCGKNINVNFRELEDKSQNFVFSIDSIERFDKTEILSIKYDGSKISADSRGEKQVEIPAVNEFRIDRLEVVNAPDQCLKIMFSDPLKDNQNMAGLVTFFDSRSGENTEIKIQIDDNCVNVFPAVKQRGEVKVTVSEGIQNVLGVKLSDSKTFTADFEMQKPQVRTVKTGLILPESENGLVYPFEAVNLKAVDVTIIKVLENNILSYIRDYSDYWNNENLSRTGVPVLRKTIHIADEDDSKIKEWNRYYLELSKLISSEPGTIYDVKISFRKSHAIFDCDTCGGGDNCADEQDVDIKDFDDYDRYYGVDDYYYSSAGYNWRNENNPCYKMYYQKDKFIEQCILATNVGMIAKKGPDNSVSVFATDLRTAKPVSGATVELYGYQQQLLAKTTTDGEGKAVFADAKKAYIAVARSGKEANYLKLEDGNSLSLSKFDVSGADVTDGLRGFLYGERGVWRPGDSIHLSFILKEEDGKSLPQGFPITLEVRNSLSQQIVKETVTKNPSNFYVFNFKTDDDAVTGSYEAVVNCGNASFRKTLRVENIKPNRLKIFAEFNKGTLTSKGNVMRITSSWLHGAKAANLKYHVSRSLKPAELNFDKFKGYTFSNVKAADFDGYMQQVGEGVLNENGQGSISDEFLSNSWRTYPNKMRAFYEVKVFEKGGAFSVDGFHIDVCPYEYYLGLKLPETDGRCLEVDKPHTVDLVAVTNKGELDSKSHKIAVRLFKLKWQYWYDSDNYISDYNSQVLCGDTLMINGKAQFTFQVSYPDWGRYMVEVRDMTSGVCASEIFYMDWPDSFGRSPMLSQGSTVVELSSDKTVYNVGETVKVNIPAPEDSRALISIETASKVIRNQWINTKAGNTEFEFKVDEKMVPGVYVFVTLLQPHGQTVNDLPIRMYGVLPVNVEDKKTKLEPVISMPDKIEAESEVQITVSEKDSKTMTYTIALVDDGILDLTHFKTPDPWKTFYSRPSLKIRTFDMFDNVIGAFGGKIEKIFSVGGDDENGGSNSSKANNFETVVKFLGPFTYSGQKRTHTIKMPKYIGSVRAMVVAGNSTAFGSAEKTATVTKPLMIFATTPRLLSTSEKFSLPVTVFTGEDKIRDVKLSIKASGGFKANGETVKELTFDGKGEQCPYFELETSDLPSIGVVEISATSGSYKSDYTLKVEIRQPNVKSQQTISKLVEQGQTVEIPFEAIGRKNTNTGKINVGAILPFNIDYHLAEVENYPYESLYSVVSQGFAFLFASKMSDMPAGRKDTVESIVKRAIEKIYAYQASSGGLSYWRNYNYTDVYITSYAGHFICEAKKAGYSVKKDFLDKWKKYQKTKAESWTPDNYSSYGTQAYRLYTLALCNEALTGQMNRLKQMKNLSDEAIIYLSGAYALSSKADAGAKLLNPIVKKGGYDRAVKLMVLCDLNDKNTAFEVAKKLSEELNSEYYYAPLNYEALSVFALGKYFDKYKPASKITCSYSFNSGAKQDINSEKLFVSNDLKFNAEGQQVVSFTNKSSGQLYVEILNQGIPEAGNEKAESSVLTAQVRYLDDDGRAIQPDNLKQGTEFTAAVTIKNPSGEYIDNLVITEMFASGWEIDNSVLESGSGDDDDDDYYYRPVSYSINYTDVRDDRKYTYFSLRSKGEITFKTRLVAAYKGEFYLPGVICEKLDDNKIFVKTKGKKVKVVD